MDSTTTEYYCTVQFDKVRTIVPLPLAMMRKNSDSADLLAVEVSNGPLCIYGSTATAAMVVVFSIDDPWFLSSPAPVAAPVAVVAVVGNISSITVLYVSSTCGRQMCLRKTFISLGEEAIFQGLMFFCRVTQLG